MHCEQSTIYTCAPAACVAALAHCGIRISEREMAALCLTNRNGTDEFNIYRGLTLALVGKPWRVRLREIPAEALAAHDAVAVICLPGHANAVIGEGGGILLHDPFTAGPTRRTVAEFATIYTGTAVTIERL